MEITPEQHISKKIVDLILLSELFRTFVVTSVLVVISTHQTIELSLQYVFQSPDDHLQKEDKIVRYILKLISNHKIC